MGSGLLREPMFHLEYSAVHLLYNCFHGKNHPSSPLNNSHWCTSSERPVLTDLIPMKTDNEEEDHMEEEEETNN